MQNSGVRPWIGSFIPIKAVEGNKGVCPFMDYQAYVCVCADVRVWHMRCVIVEPQLCPEAPANVPNYKTTCENWQEGDEKEIERAKPEGSM